MLLRGILSGGVWNGFLVGFVRGEIVPCRFCGVQMVTGICFGSVHVRESPEFHDLLSMDRSTWPRCLLWHGWLPALACSGGASPWADSVDSIAEARSESALGSYADGVCRE